MVRRQVGAGRVIYIPEIVPAIKKPPTVSMTSNYWKLPLNAKELIDAVNWASSEAMLLEANASSTTVLEVLEHEESGSLLLHMINYDAARTPSRENVKISLRAPEGGEVEEVKLLSPDLEESQVLSHRMTQSQGDESRVVFTVPQLQTYNLVVIR